jgi:hypothetical protein
MAEQFVVELGWLQERTFPLYIAQPPSTTLSAHDLLELAECFSRFRMERRSYMSSYAGQVNGASLLHEPLGEGEAAETTTR